jgi:hypothetical protein
MVKALTGEVAYIHIKKTAEVIKKPESQREATEKVAICQKRLFSN